MLRAQALQCAGDQLHERGVGNADQLARGAGGIRQRPEEVEDRADRQLPPNRHNVFHRRVVARREHEAEANFLDAARHGAGPELDPDPQGLQQVCRAGATGR